MKVGIIGSGGREHALCYAFKKSKRVKKISLDKLNYWNVELQEAYYSYKEASEKRENNS